MQTLRRCEIKHRRSWLYEIDDLGGSFELEDGDLPHGPSGKKISQTPYQQIILNHPISRVQYNAILSGLLDPTTGPLSQSALHGFLNNLEPVVSVALVEDPYAGFGSQEAAAALFEGLRQWVVQRISNVQAQIQSNQPPPRP